MVGIHRCSATQIMGNVIVRMEIELGVDAAVHQLGHTPVELTRRAVVYGVQVFFGNLLTDMEMHMAFGLHDACQDAV